MKKAVIFFLVLICLLVFFVFRPSSSNPQPVIAPLPSAQASPPPLIDSLSTIKYQDRLFHYSYIKIDQPQNLSLYSNLPKQLSTQELINQNHCSVLVNGGFYDQDNQPIGWLVNQGKLISHPVKSQFLNGYLSLTNNQASIDPLRPQTPVSLGLQSGPLLIYDNKPLVLSIKDDEFRRRLIAAQTPDNQLIFLAITGSDSLFTGPLLADTPALVMAVAQELGQPILAALNLDGGSASAFYSPKTYLEEFSFIGSYFCVQ